MIKTKHDLCLGFIFLTVSLVQKGQPPINSNMKESAKKVNEKELVSGKICQAFFLSEGFEATKNA
jgi:hypothetical protein